MRISKNQRDILFLLYAIEQKKGHRHFVTATALFSMIRRNRSQTLYPNHLRVSCHTLHKNGFIEQYRDEQLKLSYALTEQGRAVALAIYNEIVRQPS
ncbi:chromosome segregation protein ParM [Brenneria alni]|uniref:chromosome segregation protein ParM n=1 Tax=Brenneria alni TaxID=71656 RepID=UPI0011C4402D|nr:chromosome segregation protein ParM [Brenneria alni]